MQLPTVHTKGSGFSGLYLVSLRAVFGLVHYGRSICCAIHTHLLVIRCMLREAETIMIIKSMLDALITMPACREARSARQTVVAHIQRWTLAVCSIPVAWGGFAAV